MINAEIELLGQRHAVQLKYENESPVSVPIAGGGSYWHNPTAGKKMVILSGEVVSKISAPIPLFVEAREYKFLPARLTAEGMAGELQPAQV